LLVGEFESQARLGQRRQR